MDKTTYTLTIKISQNEHDSEQGFRDIRTLSVESTRGELTKHIDGVCEDIEAKFDH